jgi:small-conductance mechanosensitive channel
MPRFRRSARSDGPATSAALELARRPDFHRAIITGVAAVVALSVGSAMGDIHGHALRSKLIALCTALAFLVLAVISVRSLAGTLFAIVSVRAGRSGATAVRLIVTFVGCVVALFLALGMLAVPVQHLLLGGALTGVVVGIAAQQSLGNVFAGLVLLIARPFSVGDHIRVRAGALGGEFDGTVRGMDLTYVTVDTAEGPLHVPNSGMLAAAVGPRHQSEGVITAGTSVPTVPDAPTEAPSRWRTHRSTSRRP